MRGRGLAERGQSTHLVRRLPGRPRLLEGHAPGLRRRHERPGHP
jgi:hypothetical protein